MYWLGSVADVQDSLRLTTKLVRVEVEEIFHLVEPTQLSRYESLKTVRSQREPRPQIRERTKLCPRVTLAEGAGEAEIRNDTIKVSIA